MSEPKSAFKYKQTPPTYADYDRQTFIIPFIVLSFLLLPSLVIVAFSKSTVSFDVLMSLGYYSLVQAIFWLLVPMTVVFAILFLIRAHGQLGKACVVALAVVVVSLFTYIVLP